MSGVEGGGEGGEGGCSLACNSVGGPVLQWAMERSIERSGEEAESDCN